MKSLARFCSNIGDGGIDSAVIDAQVLGPPDIEQKVGLTGGHIFQGECLPQYMWDKRLSARTPMRGDVSVRGMYASWRKRDRDQWAECSDGSVEGYGRELGCRLRSMGSRLNQFRRRKVGALSPGLLVYVVKCGGGGGFGGSFAAEDGSGDEK